jgi:ribonucleoside-diphosphate reductase alpha chain
MLYKGGSGSGINYSPLRSSVETLSGGGTASGPVPFIASHDAGGGAIKSGGTTRRAAKMNILNADHGDIEEFITCKADAEKKAHALIDAGFDGDFRARWGAYQSVPFQNANHSVRVTDEFMQAVVDDGVWALRKRNGELIKSVRARMLWEKICEAAWVCGDPGLQFDTLINFMHTIPAHGRINASNPCSEYMSIDDSACNLASLNLRKLQGADGSLKLGHFNHAVDVLITGMDILCEGAGYPTQKIAANARKHRQLGLGFANLGAYLMYLGLPYDSDKARLIAGLLTANLTGRSYRRSAQLAAQLGAFEGYAPNAASMLAVIETHRENIDTLIDKYGTGDEHVADDGLLYKAAVSSWDQAQDIGQAAGFRNAQVTVMAPTGTIAFMMDCDTTGIEPDTSLVKYKSLVGGGSMKIVNQGVPVALSRLGYSADVVKRISDSLMATDSLADAVELSEEHHAVFDTSFPDRKTKRCLRPEAHVLMLSAIQPFVSGAISKTCNLSKDATVEDISNLYMLGWKEGLKAIAVYRDGCKRTQPLSTSKDNAKESATPAAAKRILEQEELILQLKNQIADLIEQTQASRRKMPDERQSITHKFRINGEHELKVYLTVGLYPDGSPGEIFVRCDKEGSLVSGLMDAVATLTSFGLQHGVPLADLTKKFRRTTFAPHGWTGHPQLGYASSVLDYIFRWLDLRFGSKTPMPEVIDASQEPVVALPAHAPAATNGSNGHSAEVERTFQRCPRCDVHMVRTGSCMTCPSCGLNSGCG